jgi:hypothetical protein
MPGQDGQQNATGVGGGGTRKDAPHDLTGVIDRLEQQSAGHDQISVQDLFEAFAGRLFGPLLVLPGLALLTPLGGVPLLPAGVGVFVALLAVQRVFGRTEPWVPGRLRERSIERERVVRAFKKVRTWTKRVDRVIRPRLTVLTEGRAEVFAAVLATVLGLSIPVVGLVPLAAAAPGAGIALIGLALIARDGVLMVGAYLAGVAAGWFVWVGVF